MNDPIEKLIGSIPLRDPSEDCDANVLAELRKESADKVQPLVSSPNKSLVDQDLPGNFRTVKLSFTLATTALALVFGFMLGFWLNRTDPSLANEPIRQSSAGQTQAGFGLMENIEVLSGQSKTVIVNDQIQLQDNLPVRKLETVTRKKVLVKDSQGEIKKELEVPIRKVFYSLAETI